ncbi:MAG: signal peptidase I [Kofleriaceae bacterium]
MMLTLGALIVAAALVGRRAFVVVTVRGHSMAPTLRNGERLVARRWSPTARPVTGDVIVFRPDALGYRIKRIAGVAGDPVPAWLARDPGGRIPAGHVIVRGDNPRSEGSRELGYIPIATILARTARQLPAR